MGSGDADSSRPDAGVLADAGAMSVAGAPRILSLASNVTRLTPAVELVISASVTDPDGAADLVGGQLFAPSGSSYGAFVSEETSSYEMRLSWEEIQALEPITTGAGGVDRVFIARFFDQAGNATEQSLTIVLGCTDPDLAVCRGRCVNLDTDERHCGECFNDEGPFNSICVEGERRCAHPNAPNSCTGYCTDFELDDLNCGACGITTPKYGECRDGVPTCDRERVTGDEDRYACLVDGEMACVSPLNEDHCGACGRACASGTYCRRDPDHCEGQLSLNERRACKRVCEERFGPEYSATACRWWYDVRDSTSIAEAPSDPDRIPPANRPGFGPGFPFRNIWLACRRDW